MHTPKLYNVPDGYGEEMNNKTRPQNYEPQSVLSHNCLS